MQNSLRYWIYNEVPFRWKRATQVSTSTTGYLGSPFPSEWDLIINPGFCAVSKGFFVYIWCKYGANTYATNMLKMDLFINDIGVQNKSNKIWIISDQVFMESFRIFCTSQYRWAILCTKLQHNVMSIIRNRPKSIFYHLHSKCSHITNGLENRDRTLGCNGVQWSDISFVQTYWCDIDPRPSSDFPQLNSYNTQDCYVEQNIINMVPSQCTYPNHYFYGLVQKRRNSSADALELRHFCASPSIGKTQYTAKTLNHTNNYR